MKNLSIIVKTFQGFEEILAQECRKLKFTDIEILNRAVKFTGGSKEVYRANYFLRTGLKVLVPVTSFDARSEDELYKGVKKFQWADIIDPGMSMAIEVVLHSQYFSHSKFLALRTKDAIVDQIRELTGKRPRVDLEDPDIKLSLHIQEEKVQVYLDSSGDPLFKRGYRIGLHQAPLNEVMAAGLLLMAGWHGQGNLVDPMCGSGTILIEGAMIAYGLPPGMYRKSFGFEKWKNFDQDIYDEVVEEEVPVKPFEHRIVGGDILAKNISISRENLHRSSLYKKVELLTMPMEEFVPPEGGGLLVTNPPYGERLTSPKLNQLYGDLGSRLKHFYPDYEAWIFSGSQEAMKSIGLKPEKRFRLLNGAIPCTFNNYKLYKGSKISSRQNKNPRNHE